MQKINLFYAFMAFIAFFGACKKEDDKPEEIINNLSLEKTAITLKVEETQSVAILTGNGSYSVKSSDESKATATIEKSSVKVVAKAEGEATLTLSDAKGKQAELRVTVINLVVPGEEMTIEKGATHEHTLTFGSNYEVTSADEKIATASVKDNTLTITAVEKGTTKISVKDPKTEKVQEFSVTVNAFTLSVEKTEITIKVNETQSIAIQKGNGNYSVKSSDESKATAIIEENNVKITAKAEGEITLTITDTEEKQVEIKVTVINLVVPGEEVTLGEGKTKTHTLTFGSNYEVSSSDAKIATASVNNNILTITGVKEGTTKISVKDPKTEKVQEFSVTVINLVVPGEEVTLGEGKTKTHTLTFGSNYQVSSSDAKIATASVNNNILTITAVKKGTAKISVKDPKTEKVQEFSVTVVGVFSVETKKLTIKYGEQGNVKLINGNGNYDFKVEPEEAVLVMAHTNDILKVQGQKVGKATVTVTDKETGKKDTFAVEVTGFPFTIEKNSITLEEGNYEQIRITSGNPNYTIKYTLPNIVQTQISDNMIYVRALKAGKVQIIITDTAGETQRIAVTVNATSGSEDIFEIENYENDDEDSDGEEIAFVSLKSGVIAKGRITIPAEGVKLMDEIFSGNREITEVDLNNIEYIGEGAFYDTKNLTKVTMKKVKKIGFGAFTGSGLTEITLPASVTNISGQAFMNNYNLNKITVLSTTPPTISNNTFSSSAGNKAKRVLYVPKGTKKAYEKAEYWGAEGEFKEIIELK
ncbi:MAG: leucine-rich repeat domain-containing protein [Capnocytophaga sp.]|nr:leucine-rich repeat domain-containing protein [Capnocytophaga sp.]